ncbi:MAG: PAS domain S-box protein [Chloroflexaceae bacterium]|nr:PAS domain S-box protein [Chloroflexaceae bacterium]
MSSNEMEPEGRDERRVSVSESLFTNNHAVMLLIDPDTGAIVDANPAACVFYGYSRETLCSLTISDINTLSSVEVYEEMQRARHAQRNHFFFRHRLSSGDIHDVEVYSGPIDHAGKPLLYSIIHDITERKQAEEALRQSETALQVANARLEQRVAERTEALRRSQALLQSVLDHAPAAIYFKDTQGRFLLVNRFTEQLLNLSPAQMIGKTGYDLFPTEYAAQWERHEQQVLQSGVAIEFEEQALLSDGMTHSFLSIRFPVFDAQGDISAMGGISTDITERKRAEAELQRAREEAEAANRAKSVFLARMSHELRTPLNAILGFTQLLNRDRQMMPRHHEYLRIIQRSGEHLLALINDVLEMSRIEAGRAELHQQAFDLHHLLHDLTDMFQLRARTKHLSLRLDLAPEVPSGVAADERKLRQVLINLLSNAIKFTHQGQVTLRVSVVASGPAGRPIGAQAQAEEPPLPLPPPIVPAPSPSPSALTGPTARMFLRFEVKDTGIGIAPDDLVRIFDPFFQMPQADQAQEGTGLGLPISQHFVKMMGGAFDVESRLGQGSTFSFVLPVHPAAVPRDEPSLRLRRVVSLAPGQPSFRILMVEDHEDSRTLLRDLLTSLGFVVREAADGREGVAVWRQWSPHLIFMDIRMPFMDGLEATRCIKATMQGQDTPIIALTASTFEESRVDILAAGCDDLLRKPFRHEDLIGKLMKYLNARFVGETEPEQEPQQGTIWKPRLSHQADLEYLKSGLANLPFDWVRSLHRATILGNIQQMNDLIDHIRETHPDLSAKLQVAIDTFGFDQITAATAAMVDSNPRECQ